MSARLPLARSIRDWRGRWRACRGCGRTNVAELADGYCQDCFADAFGPLGLGDIPPIGDETMDDHAAYDLPAASTLDVLPAADLPTLFQQAPRQCVQCGVLKGEGDYSDAEWVKARPICRDCEQPVAPTPPPQAITPRSWHKHYPWCVNCGTDQRKPMSSGLCVDCYKASVLNGYTGRKGPNLLGVRDEVDARRRVDAYLATIERPAAPLHTQPPAAAPPPSTVNRSVADELRALLDTLARERNAVREEQERLTARLADLSTQCDAVQTTLTLVTR